MWYTILWLIVWLLLGNSTFTFGTGGAFWALVVAIVADLFFVGFWPNRTTWFRRA